MTTDEITRSKLRDRGQVTLPTEVRLALHVDTGDDIEFALLPNGDVVMRGMKMIPADQAWFWSESWQRGEREASVDIETGRMETFKDDESFLASLGESD